MNTEEERERIREAFRFSRANLALEGFEPSKRALGHLTEEEYMEALRGTS
ncbi:MAG: hypothetical protein LBB76_00635 [Azoarcus sp.]|jgi:hypothetical protein|nr:hypothetical protein [Azoarcus sp.]